MVFSYEAPPAEFRTWKIVCLEGKNIWTCNGDGSHRKRIVSNADSPCWSPDKTRIAFSRGAALWVANADGSQAKRQCGIDNAKGGEIEWITWCPRAMEERATPPSLATADWALMGPSIVFSGRSERAAKLYQYVFSRPRLGAREVGFLEGGTPFEFSHYEFPTISKDGRRLALAVNGDVWIAENLEDPQDPNAFGGWDITRAYAAASFDAPSYRGSRENYITKGTSWSPDGKSLAFGVVRHGGSGMSDIGVLDFSKWDFIRGKTDVGVKWLSHSGFTPCFSPDGKWVLFESLDRGTLEAVSLDGRRTVRIPAEGSVPRW